MPLTLGHNRQTGSENVEVNAAVQPTHRRAQLVRPVAAVLLKHRRRRAAAGHSAAAYVELGELDNNDAMAAVVVVVTVLPSNA